MFNCDGYDVDNKLRLMYLVNNGRCGIMNPDLHFNTESWLWASPVTETYHVIFHDV